MKGWAFATVVLLLPISSAARASDKPHVWSDGLRPPAPVVAPKPAQTRVVQPPAEPVNQIPADLPPPAERPPIEQGGSLDLMCFGGGSANKPTYTTVDGSSNVSGNFNLNGNHGSFDASGNSSATIMGQRSQGFEDQVSLRIQGTEGRVRMPRTMLPIIRGGEDGWFKLKDIQIKPNEITASVAENVLNNPKLRVDRYSGSIIISGKAGDYSGRCRRFNPQEMQRQF